MKRTAFLFWNKLQKSATPQFWYLRDTPEMGHVDRDGLAVGMQLHTRQIFSGIFDNTHITWRKLTGFNNSSDAGNGIFQLLRSIPCLLMYWLLKAPVHQEACNWLCRTHNMHCYSRINFIYLGQAKSKIWFKIQMSFIILKQSNMLKVNIWIKKIWDIT